MLAIDRTLQDAGSLLVAPVAGVTGQRGRDFNKLCCLLPVTVTLSFVLFVSLFSTDEIFVKGGEL